MTSDIKPTALEKKSYKRLRSLIKKRKSTIEKLFRIYSELCKFRIDISPATKKSISDKIGYYDKQIAKMEKEILNRPVKPKVTMPGDSKTSSWIEEQGKIIQDKFIEEQDQQVVPILDLISRYDSLLSTLKEGEYITFETINNVDIKMNVVTITSRGNTQINKVNYNIVP